MSINDVLREFGLSDKEIELYLKLLELGSVTSGGLMKELNFYSKTVYEILDRLINKGLASFIIKSNIKYFEAENPEKFLSTIDEEKENLDQKETDFRKILPELNARRKLSKEPQDATIYKGKKGMKSVLEDSLKQKGEILVFSTGGFPRILGSYFELWNKKRAKAGIVMVVLRSEDLRDKAKELTKHKLIKLKYLPSEFYNPAAAMVYSNKVVITVWSETPIATMIRSKEVANSYRSYFNLLWKIAKT